MKENVVKKLKITERAFKEEKRVLVGKPSIDRPWEKYYTEDVLNVQFPKMSCYRYLIENNKKYPFATGINYFGMNINHLKIKKEIDKVANAFVALGVKPGDNVTICSPNTPEAIYMFYALSKIGAVADMIDPRANENLMKKYLDTTKSKYLVTVDLFYEKFTNILDKTNVEKVVTFKPTESIPKVIKKLVKIKEPDFNITYSDKIINWQTFIKNGKKVKGSVEAEYKENRTVAILHTGGTTGIPKGVNLTNDGLNSLAKQLEVCDLHFNRDEKLLGLMPLFAGYGLGVGTHTALSNGMQTIPIPTYVPEEMAQLVKKYHPTMIAASPAHWEIFRETWPKLTANDKDNSLEYFKGSIVGGDSINIKLEQDINEFFKKYNGKYKLIKGYGATENLVMTVCMNNRINDIGSVGIPLPGNVVSVFNHDTNEELSFGEVGEVCARGPAVMLGYYEMKNESQQSLQTHKDGNVWLHTGDLGYMTEEGKLYIKGRLKRLIIRYDGCKVYPYEIEQAMLQHPAVANCVVVGLKDQEHTQGELPKAFLVLEDEYKENAEKIKAEVKQICDDHIVDYAVPTDYEVMDDLPRTGVGKIDVLALKEGKTKVRTLKLDK